MVNLNKEIKYVKGVGPNREVYIKRLNNILSKRL